MKRILHITGTMDRAGAETMVMNLYRAIDKSKFQFDFLYFTDRKCDFDEEIESLGGRVYRIPESNLIKRVLKIIRFLKANPQWDTVHAHNLLNNGFNLWAAYKAGINKRISHAHSTNDAKNTSLAGKIYKKLTISLIKRYASIKIACGIEAANFLYPKKEGVLIYPNSIDLKKFAHAKDNYGDYLRKEFELNDSVMILLQLGRLNEIKNHKFSFEIIAELKKRKVDFRFMIAGQGALEQELKEVVRSKDLENEVLFLGLRKDVSELLAGSDLMLMPSLYEGFPVVLVESQASGTPALIADTISSEVDLGVNAVVFESLNSNPKTWAEKIVVSTKQYVLPRSERLKRLADKGFDIYTNTRNLEELYTK